jgi:hypothetical protein
MWLHEIRDDLLSITTNTFRVLFHSWVPVSNVDCAAPYLETQIQANYITVPTISSIQISESVKETLKYPKFPSSILASCPTTYLSIQS